MEKLIAADRLRPAFLFEACPVRRLDEAALRADPALAASDPPLDSVLNLNEPADYEAARCARRPRSRCAASARCGARRGPGAEPLVVRAATLAGAADAVGLELDEHVVAALNGDQIMRDPEEPLATGDTVAFLAADAGG